MSSHSVPLNFTKMHGLGNDFMLLDATKNAINLSKEQIRWLADRHFGVGFDQLLLIEKANRAGVDFAYRIFNADGSEVEQCGNGARCFARYVQDKGLSKKNPIRVATCSGVIELQVEGEWVRVNMGIPKTAPADIPFIASEVADFYTLGVGGEVLKLAVVNMGNPHAVLRTINIDKAPIARLGPLLESHSRFPKKVNVGFMQVLTRSSIHLRVYERGVGETLACGTGACAAVVAGIRAGWLDNKVTVKLAGGDLVIGWEGANCPVFMEGPATKVYEGWLPIELSI